MIRNPATILLLLTAVSTSGCLWGRHGKDVSAARIQEPPLSENMTTQELVDYVNRQNQDLNGWQSTATKMEVRLPNMIPQRLSGSIACQTPSYFRLTADNLVAKTDLGSNNHRCWFYVQPGESAVMTWKHEDTPLLQQVPLGVPHIDPNWLMLVLGITPLDASDYQIRSAANQQLWLESIAASPSGRPLRRVIKVDRVHHVVREHLIADSEANVLVKAVLSDHRWKDNRLIPHCVQLDFPQMKTEIRLTFREIETNPRLPDSLWYLPDSEVDVVDVGEIIRHKIAAENPHLADRLLGRSQGFTEVMPAAGDFETKELPASSMRTPVPRGPVRTSGWDSPSSATRSWTPPIRLPKSKPVSRPPIRFVTHRHLASVPRPRIPCPRIPPPHRSTMDFWAPRPRRFRNRSGAPHRSPTVARSHRPPNAVSLTDSWDASPPVFATVFGGHTGL